MFFRSLQRVKNIKFIFWMKPVDAVILYSNDVDLLKKWILNPIGIKKIFIRDPLELIFNFQILFNFIKNIKFLFRGSTIRRARFIYEKSLIESIKPKIVITMKDNSEFLSEISKIDTQRLYVAIQNGTRFDYIVEDITKTVFQELNRESFIYFCWGDYEKDVYKKYSDYNCTFIPVGSIRQSISKHYQISDERFENKKFDFFMSSTIHGLTDYNTVRKIYGNDVVQDEWTPINSLIAKHLNRYIQERGKSLVIALRGNSDFEKKLYKSIFSKNVLFYNRSYNNLGLDNYYLVKNSNIIISFAGSLALEALGCGKKILQIDYSNKKQYCINYPNSFWQLYDNSYNSFCDSLDFISSIKINDYNNKTRKYQNYVMQYDKSEPTYIKIQDLIKQKIKLFA